MSETYIPLSQINTYSRSNQRVTEFRLFVAHRRYHLRNSDGRVRPLYRVLSPIEVWQTVPRPRFDGGIPTRYRRLRGDYAHQQPTHQT